MVTPTFSVIIATYDRGPLIEATLESVVRQTFDNFEVLVVSDGPAAPGLAATVSRFGKRFSLIECADRCGSQFAPNNRGWEIATGRFIAYLGHDDIWLPGHLAALRAAFEMHPDADFAASGCIHFGPPGSGEGYVWVTGLFDPDDRSMAFSHFFPPSSVAHRRDLPDDMRWPDARMVRGPVDSQFMLEAAKRGCVFTSTTTVTVLKFNSAFRYLSYLSPDDEEQRDALELTESPAALEETIQTAIADAKASGNYMTVGHAVERDWQPGEVVRVHARTRGIDTQSVEVLERPTWMTMENDSRGIDWHSLERDGDRTWRWSGPNPRPRLLIPFIRDGLVRVSLHLDAIATDDIRDSLEVLVDRRSAPTVTRMDPDSSRVVIEIETVLRRDRPSVVELRMNRTVAPSEFVPGSTDPRRVGVCLAGIHLEPITRPESTTKSRRMSWPL